MLVVIGRSSLTAILEVEAATAGAPTMGLTGELGAVATAAAEATQTATSLAPHVSVSTPARKSKNYGARRPPR
jgi:microcompartment protein CcmL/EutN